MLIRYKREEEDFEFSPEQADRFASFYSDLRDDIQDLHLCGHDPFLFKEMREKREAKKEEEEVPHPPIRKREIRPRLTPREIRFSGSK